MKFLIAFGVMAFLASLWAMPTRDVAKAPETANLDLRSKVSSNMDDIDRQLMEALADAEREDSGAIKRNVEEPEDLTERDLKEFERALDAAAAAEDNGEDEDEKEKDGEDDQIIGTLRKQFPDMDPEEMKEKLLDTVEALQKYQSKQAIKRNVEEPEDLTEKDLEEFERALDAAAAEDNGEDEDDKEKDGEDDQIIGTLRKQFPDMDPEEMKEKLLDTVEALQKYESKQVKQRDVEQLGEFTERDLVEFERALDAAAAAEDSDEDEDDNEDATEGDFEEPGDLTERDLEEFERALDAAAAAEDSEDEDDNQEQGDEDDAKSIDALKQAFPNVDLGEIEERLLSAAEKIEKLENKQTSTGTK